MVIVRGGMDKGINFCERVCGLDVNSIDCSGKGANRCRYLLWCLRLCGSGRGVGGRGITGAKVSMDCSKVDDQ